MKQIFVISLIMISSIFLVLGLSFLIFNIPNLSLNLMGFAIYNDSTANMANDSNQIVNEEIITKQDALNAINESEQIMNELLRNDLSVSYINDSLIEAKMIFEQVNYAEMLRGNINSTQKEKQEANSALRLIYWKNLTYSNVLFYTKDIENRKKKIFGFVKNKFRLK